MQRFGPPPSYPHLKIAGLNSPIPPGASFGYHPGGWGKPPVDENGRPLYGNVFGPYFDAAAVREGRFGRALGALFFEGAQRVCQTKKPFFVPLRHYLRFQCSPPTPLLTVALTSLPTQNEEAEAAIPKELWGLLESDEGSSSEEESEDESDSDDDEASDDEKAMEGAEQEGLETPSGLKYVCARAGLAASADRRSRAHLHLSCSTARLLPAAPRPWASAWRRRNRSTCGSAAPSRRPWTSGTLRRPPVAACVVFWARHRRTLTPPPPHCISPFPAARGEGPSLYQVIPERAAEVKGEVVGSSHTYDLTAARPGMEGAVSGAPSSKGTRSVANSGTRAASFWPPRPRHGTAAACAFLVFCSRAPPPPRAQMSR